MIFLSYLLTPLPISIIFLAVTGGIFLLIWALYEPRTLTIEKITMPPDKNTNNQTQSSLRILFFTDLHANKCKITDQKLLDAIFSQEFDILLFGGDACNNITDHQAALYRLSLIVQNAKKLGIPCYAVRGNHDYFISKNQFENIGFHLLEHEAKILLDRKSKQFAIIGVDDLGKTQGPIQPLPYNQFQHIPPERRILLAHQPVQILHHQTEEFAFFLAGHYHGGQIRLPFSMEFRIFRRDLLSQSGIRQGFFKKNNTFGYISRGCGCSGISLRLLSKPEITFVDFYFPANETEYPI